MLHRSDVAGYTLPLVNDNSKVRDTPKNLARGRRLDKVVFGEGYPSTFSAFLPRSGLHGDAHALTRVLIVRDDVDTGVIDICALEAVAGEPVQDQ